jgi:hypothetical protein
MDFACDGFPKQKLLALIYAENSNSEFSYLRLRSVRCVQHREPGEKKEKGVT